MQKQDIQNNLKQEGKMKVNILRIILIILLLCTFRIIFEFSSQNSQQSSSLSKKVTITITQNIKTINERPQTEKKKILLKIETIIRKIAHFSIYTIVRSITYVTNFYIQNKRNK